MSEWVDEMMAQYLRETPNDGVVCGETMYHDAVLRDERDGVRVYDCRRCGAEIIEGDSE